jgi:paired amphipathic helix protein Sin3a
LCARAQYEESLFKCEDDRFELDMLIETNASSVRVIEPLMEEAVNSRGNKVSISGLKPIHMKAIERVYGDHGTEIVEHIKRAPRVALNVVLPRLRQKDDEWRKARRDMNKIWREVYKDNYYKSLDHRSFYFKQVDKKGLSPKAFIQEMRSAQEAAQVDPTLSPLLSFLMPDADIHDDILTVISKSAASELYEVAEARVRKFFTVVLHVFLGLR